MQAVGKACPACRLQTVVSGSWAAGCLLHAPTTAGVAYPAEVTPAAMPKKETQVSYLPLPTAIRRTNRDCAPNWRGQPQTLTFMTHGMDGNALPRFACPLRDTIL